MPHSRPGSLLLIHALERRTLFEGSTLPFQIYATDGYAAPHIEEFLNLVNTTDLTVNYEIWIHYESARPSEMVSARTIAPHSRGGETMSSPRLLDLNLPEAEPYAIEVGSDQPLVANLTRYDRGAIGTSLTGVADTRWTVRSYPLTWDGVEYLENIITWFNPGTVDAELTITFTELAPSWTGGEIGTITRTAPAGKRGGLLLDVLEELRDNSRGAMIIDIRSTQPVIVTSTQLEVGIGASMELGVPGSGSTEWVVPYVEPLYDSTTEDYSGPVNLTIVNMSETESATVDVTYIRDDGVVRVYEDELVIAPGANHDLLMAYLGVPTDDEASEEFATRSRGTVLIRSAEGAPLSVMSSTGRWPDRRGGGERMELVGEAAIPANSGANRLFISEGFMIPPRAGFSLFSTLAIYVPPSEDSNVTVTLSFLLGDEVLVEPEVFTVVSGLTQFVDLHALEQLLEASDALSVPYFEYAIRITASQPVIAAYRHDDHFFSDRDGAFLINAVAAPDI